MQGLVEGREDEIAFREVDISKDPSAVKEYGIQYTPTVIVLDASGKQVDFLEGVPEESEVEEAIGKALSP